MSERTKPYRFVVQGFRLDVVDDDGENWAAEAIWSDEDGCFCLAGDPWPGNYDFAPCDLEEIAHALRMIPRDIPARPSVDIEAARKRLNECTSLEQVNDVIVELKRAHGPDLPGAVTAAALAKADSIE